MESKRLELLVFLVFFVGLSILTFFVFQPFLHVLVLAAVLAVLFHPLNKRLTTIFPKRKTLIALFLVVVAFVFLIVPILFFGLQILKQAESFFSLMHVGQGYYVQALQQGINKLVQHVVPSFSISISDIMTSALSFVGANLTGLLTQTASLFFEILFLLFGFFLFLHSGEGILDSIISLSPFEKGQNKQIADSLYRTITSIVRGTLFVGFVRLVLLTLAFYFLGIPNALLWGSIGGLIGALPGIGSPIALIPAFLYLFFYANIFWAIAMGVFGVLLIFFVDNLLSAYFFGKGLDVPSLFVLFSILGGIIFFGPLGFIFGPIILSLFISAIDMYKILVLKRP